LKLTTDRHEASRDLSATDSYLYIISLGLLHWFKAAERIGYKLALFVRRCRQGIAPSYLADELCQPADTEAQRRRRSASSSLLIVRRTRLSTVGDRAFPVAGRRVWNGLPQHVTSASSLAVLRSHLKTHLFRRRFQSLHRCLVQPKKWRSQRGHVNRFCYLLTYLLTTDRGVLGRGREAQAPPPKCWHIIRLLNYLDLIETN